MFKINSSYYFNTFESAMARDSLGLISNFLRNFFKPLDNFPSTAAAAELLQAFGQFPSTAAAAEASASVVSSNLPNFLSLTTFLASLRVLKSSNKFSDFLSFFSSRSLNMANPAAVSKSTNITTTDEIYYYSTRRTW
uniref:Uncharacterized protein n=1 Tax=Lepeophtheirus salmonis TaxID=72036 RepID=A0A0K2UXE0_LEPSM